MAGEYGPPRPDFSYQDYSNFRKPSYLQGHAKKILYDLIKVARLYNGRLVRIFDYGTKEPCTTCVDTITGAVVLKDCPVCGGTGTTPRNYIGEFWAFADFGPKYTLGTEMGNTENPGGLKDSFVVLGAPLLKDQWLLVTVDTKEVFEIYDVLPQIVAMQGFVVTQVAACARMPVGSVENKVVDW